MLNMNVILHDSVKSVKVFTVNFCLLTVFIAAIFNLIFIVHHFMTS